jgi:ethanolamine utilization protein EutM
MSGDGPRRALGMLETRGWVAAVEAADAMAKAARVEIARYDVTRDARVTLLVRGPLAEVEAAVAAGQAAAARVGSVLRGHVIPSPDAAIEFMLAPGPGHPGGGS